MRGTKEEKKQLIYGIVSTYFVIVYNIISVNKLK